MGQVKRPGAGSRGAGAARGSWWQQHFITSLVKPKSAWKSAENCALLLQGFESVLESAEPLCCLNVARTMIKAVIFDLDNCLAAADEPGEQLLAPAFAAMRKANCGTLAEDALGRAFADCWRCPLDRVATDHGFSPEMLDAGWRALAAAEVTRPMRGYGDLEMLAALSARLFLVTSGFRRLQRSKIRALRAEALFAAIFIDAIDEPERLGKQGIFKRIMDTHRFAPQEVLVVGDNPDAEIAAGKRLGMITVQMLRPGVLRGQNADFYVGDLRELKALLERFRGT